MEMNAVISMKTWRIRCTQRFLPKFAAEPHDNNCSHLPTHLRQEVHEWMLRDSRGTHPMDAVRKWRDFSFPCLFSLFSFALLLSYYYMLLCVRATFFHAFLKGRMENGKDSNPVSRRHKKKCWVLIYLIIRGVWELNQLLELRVKAPWQIYMQVSDSLEWKSKHQLNTLKRHGGSVRNILLLCTTPVSTFAKV